MSSNWSVIRKGIISENKQAFLNSFDEEKPSSKKILDLPFRKFLELFRKVIVYEIGVKDSDDICESILIELNKIFDDNVSFKEKKQSLKILSIELDPFLKKIVYLKSGDAKTNYFGVKDKSLNVSIRDLNLDERLTNFSIKLGNENPISINNYRDDNSCLFHIANAYFTRNKAHDSPKYNRKEVYEKLESVIIVYLYAVAINYELLESIVNGIPDFIEEERYKNYIQSKLSANNSFQLLKTEFGVSTDELEKFELVLRAKGNKKTIEKAKYLGSGLRDIKKEQFKLMPEISKLLQKSKYILIHGIATSGKTTFLKKIGRKFLSDNSEGLVFYIELGKDYEEGRDASIVELVKNTYKKHTDIELITLKEQKVLILLDGLDEVPFDNKRDIIINQIEQIKKEYDNIKIILSSRSCDYINDNPTIDEYFDKYQLLPLNPNEMIKIGETILGKNDTLKNFIKLVKKSELLNVFPKTPLTTILLAIIFKEKDIDVKDLPRNITELYSKFIDIFLHKWDKSRGISEQFKIQQKEFVLQTVAQYLHDERKKFISKKELTELITELKREYPIEVIDDIELFIKRLCNRTSLLIKNEDGNYGFFHLTMQEFLNAKKLSHKDEDKLVENFHDDWWLNTNIFYAGKEPTNFDVLGRIAKMENFPIDGSAKINYIIHTSKVLSAAHTIKHSERKKSLESMLKVFDSLIKDIVDMILGFEGSKKNIEIRIFRRSLLDIVMFLRDFFSDFFMSKYHNELLKEIWTEILNSSKAKEFSDITLYCLSYCLAVDEREANYLLNFIDSKNFELNVRWYKIVEVDIDIKKLEVQQNQTKHYLKIKRNATKHSEYIKRQFKEKLKKHYKSITGLE